MNVETELEIYRLVFSSKTSQRMIKTALAIYGWMKPKTRHDFRIKKKNKETYGRKSETD